jgi:hypothetical protein
MSILGDIGKSLGRGVLKGREYTSKGINKGLDKVADGLVKEIKPTIANAYLGLGPTKAATGLFIAGAAIYGTGKGFKAYHDMKPQNGDITYSGPPPIFAGDGIQNTTKAPTLGASGNLVFGLNAQRRG